MGRRYPHAYGSKGQGLSRCARPPCGSADGGSHANTDTSRFTDAGRDAVACASSSSAACRSAPSRRFVTGPQRMSRPGFVPAPLAQLPWLIILLVCAIGGFGVIVLFSAAGGDPRWAMPQGVRFGVFLVMALALSRVRLSHWSMIAFPLYGIFLVMLIGVELLGAVAGGSQRWLDLGFIRIQPSEMMKVAIVLACAKFYDMLPASEIRRFGAIWPAAVMIGVPAALVMLQPDLGTALMITAGGLTVMFLAGIPLRLFIGGTLALAVSVPIIVNYVLHDYQRNRVLTFLNPENDPLGTGYHIMQSKIAIGSGGNYALSAARALIDVEGFHHDARAAFGSTSATTALGPAIVSFSTTSIEGRSGLAIILRPCSTAICGMAPFMNASNVCLTMV